MFGAGAWDIRSIQTNENTELKPITSFTSSGLQADRSKPRWALHSRVIPFDGSSKVFAGSEAYLRGMSNVECAENVYNHTH